MPGLMWQEFCHLLLMAAQVASKSSILVTLDQQLHCVWADTVIEAADAEAVPCTSGTCVINAQLQPRDVSWMMAENDKDYHTGGGGE